MKKVMKKIVVGGALLFSLTIAACGGSKNPTPSQPATPSEPTQPATPSPSEPGDEVKVSAVSLNKVQLSVDIGSSAQLEATVLPTNATNKAVTWSTTNAAIATVENGLVTGVSAGKAVITVTTADGNKKAACSVTVNEPLPSAEQTVKIVLRECFGQTIKTNLTNTIEEFRKAVLRNDKVDVQVSLSDSSNYTSLESDIVSDLSVGQVPNIAVAYPDHVAHYMDEEGDDVGKYVIELGQYADDPEIGFGREEWLGDDTNYTGTEDFIEAYIEEGKQFTRDGLYVIPFMKSSEAMYYNLKALRKAFQYHDPSISTDAQIKRYMSNITWDDFMALCETIAKHKDDADKPFGDKLDKPAFYDSDSNLMITALYQQNIAYSSIKNGAGVIDFAEGEARQSVEELVAKLDGYYKKGLFTTKGTNGTYGSNSFKSEESVFSIGSTGGAGYNMTTDFEIGVCRVPTFGNDAKYVSQGPSFCMMKNPKESAEVSALKAKYSWKLIKYLTNAEVNTAMCIDGSEGYLPVRNSAYSTDKYIDFASTPDYLVETANVVREDIDYNFISTPCFKGSSVLRKQIGDILAPVFLNTSTISDAVQTAINNTITQM